MERYYTDIEGAEGPYGREQLDALVRRGLLGVDSNIVREGDTEWRAAREVVPELFAEKGRTSSGGRGWLKWAVIGGVAVALTGLGVGLLLWAPWSSGGLVDEDFLRASLPSDVSSFQYSPGLTEHEASDGFPDLDAASMALFCSGRDIAGKLVDAEGDSVDTLAANGVFDLFESPDVALELQCGRSTAEKAEPGWLLIRAGEEERPFLVWHGQEANLIGARDHSFSGLDGLCMPNEENPASCAPGPALVGRDGWWVYGNSGAVADFARDWTREDRTETTSMEIVRLLSAAMSPAMEVRTVVKPDQLGILLRGACFRSAPSIALTGCFSDSLDDSVQRIQSLTRGVGWQRRPMVEGEELRHEYLFLARDEADADSIATELDAVSRDWRAHLENTEAQAIEDMRESGGAHADFREAQLRAFVRAVHESEASVDGELVRWEIATDLVDSEERAATQRREALHARYEAIGRIVRALETEEKPERGDLVAVLGEQAADLILMPRATAAQCEQIRGRIAELESAGVQPSEFGAKFRQTQRFSTGSCAGMPMPQTLLSCVLEAPSFTNMEGCKGPSIGVRP